MHAEAVSRRQLDMLSKDCTETAPKQLVCLYLRQKTTAAQALEASIKHTSSSTQQHLRHICVAAKAFAERDRHSYLLLDMYAKSSIQLANGRG